MRTVVLAPLVLLLGLVPGCQHQVQSPLVLLVSLDGFRWDYPDQYSTPHLQWVRSNGASAKALIPVFPTKTFPNHYSIVTGLYPQRHGVVGNRVFDPALGRLFSMDSREDLTDSLWWQGEPIWVSAGKAGKRTGVVFWPGSEAEILGVRPTYWLAYDPALSYPDRLSQVFQWLDAPEEARPQLILAYFPSADSSGHKYGPDSVQTSHAVQRIDETLGQLLQGLRERGLLSRLDLIIVSDHGMTSLGPSRVIFLDDYLSLSKVRLSEISPAAFIWPQEHYEQEAWERLRAAHPALHVYRRNELPERWQLRDSVRTAPIVALADEGWTITTRDRFVETAGYISPGGHGYDNSLPSMHGIFLAAGPSFRKNLVVEPFECVHVHALLSLLLGVQPMVKADSRLEPVSGMLVRPDSDPAQ